MTEFAIDGGDQTLWCRDLGLNRDGKRNFSVINGEWEGVFDPVNGLLTVNYDQGEYPARIIWEGTVPDAHNHHYNAAIDWINEQVSK